MSDMMKGEQMVLDVLLVATRLNVAMRDFHSLEAPANIRSHLLTLDCATTPASLFRREKVVELGEGKLEEIVGITSFLGFL